MLNYYKILGLHDFATLAEVKKAYKQKIRLYHPDVNPSENAVEITQHLNTAKTILCDTIKKLKYDENLKSKCRRDKHLAETKHWSKNTDFHEYWTSLSRQERKRKVAKRKFAKEKMRYARSLQSLSFKNRIIGGIALIAWGLQLFYSNYFIMYPGYEVVYITFSIMIFITGVFICTNEYYNQKLYYPTLDFFGKRFLLTSRLFFFLAVPLGLISISALSELREKQVLSNNYELYIAEINNEASGYGSMVYSYSVGGNKYSKSIKSSQDIYKLNESKIVIKYAVNEPKISEPISIKESKTMLKEL